MNTMLKVTPSATEQVAKFFEGKEVSPIRIYTNRGG
jgi:hypothetical protein